MADDQRGVRIFLQARFEPERAFKIEIVGRLVEQQKIRLGEQGRGERDPHAPAAGKLGHRTFEIGIGKAETGENFGRPRGCAVSVDGIELRIELGHVLGRRGLKCCIERIAPRIGGEDGVDQGDRRRRMFLIDRADARGFREQNLAAERHILAEDELEQGRFADPVAADKTDFRSGRDRNARRIEKAPAPGVKNEILNPEAWCGRLNYRCVGKIFAGSARGARGADIAADAVNFNRLPRHSSSLRGAKRRSNPDQAAPQWIASSLRSSQ